MIPHAVVLPQSSFFGLNFINFYDFCDLNALAPTVHIVQSTVTH